MGNKIKVILAILLIFVMLSAAGCAPKITFNPNGGNIISGETEQKYKNDVEMVPPVVSRDGYDFDGWDGTLSGILDDTTVNAIWTKLYNVTFDPAGGAVEDEALLSQIVRDGADAVLPEVTREGYDFDGWDVSTTGVASDITATAVWTKLYTVTFDLAGGTQGDETALTQIIREGEAATAPAVTKNLYNFTGWDKTITAITEDMAITAVWQRKTFTATEIFQLISPATVEINTYRRDNDPYATGSGFLISSDGRVVTNYHVIEEAYEIKVRFADETEYTVNDIIAYDKNMDLVILKIDIENAPFLEIFEGTVNTGEAIYALGSSLGLSGTFSSGIISTAAREVDGNKYIQITAPVSPGNSGGPLVDEHGYVIGINTAQFTEGQNLNLSIPIIQLQELTETNLSMTSFFEKTAYFQWMIFEKMVTEQDTKNGNEGQKINSGETIDGIAKNDDDYDYYYAILPSGKDENGKTLIHDLIVYVYVEDLSSDVIFVLSASDSDDNGDTIEEDDLDSDFFAYGDGYIVAYYLYDVEDSTYYDDGYDRYGIILSADTGAVNQEYSTYVYFAVAQD